MRTTLKGGWRGRWGGWGGRWGGAGGGLDYPIRDKGSPKPTLALDQNYELNLDKLVQDLLFSFR